MLLCIKRNQCRQGYLVQIMETYAEDDAVADPVPNDPPLPDLINITA
jgi:hypothetical protein